MDLAAREPEKIDSIASSETAEASPKDTEDTCKALAWYRTATPPEEMFIPPPELIVVEIAMASVSTIIHPPARTKVLVAEASTLRYPPFSKRKFDATPEMRENEEYPSVRAFVPLVIVVSISARTAPPELTITKLAEPPDKTSRVPLE